MIHERPGAPNDRETYIGNLDQEVDLDKYRENFDKINWGSCNCVDNRIEAFKHTIYEWTCPDHGYFYVWKEEND